MQKLSLTETLAKIEQLPGTNVDRTNHIWNRAQQLAPGESLHVPLHEYTGKTNLVKAIRSRGRTLGLKFGGYTLPNGEGWLIIRKAEDDES